MESFPCLAVIFVENKAIFSLPVLLFNYFLTRYKKSVSHSAIISRSSRLDLNYITIEIFVQLNKFLFFWKKKEILYEILSSMQSHTVQLVSVLKVLQHDEKYTYKSSFKGKKKNFLLISLHDISSYPKFLIFSVFQNVLVYTKCDIGTNYGQLWILVTIIKLMKAINVSTIPNVS